MTDPGCALSGELLGEFFYCVIWCAAAGMEKGGDSSPYGKNVEPGGFSRMGKVHRREIGSEIGFGFLCMHKTPKPSIGRGVFICNRTSFVVKSLLTQPKEAEWLQLYPNLKPVP